MQSHGIDRDLIGKYKFVSDNNDGVLMTIDDQNYSLITFRRQLVRAQIEIRRSQSRHSSLCRLKYCLATSTV